MAQAIFEKFNAMVEAESKEAMTEIAATLTVKELRELWESVEAPHKVRMKIMSEMRKADWVEMVVFLAMDATENPAIAPKEKPAAPLSGKKFQVGTTYYVHYTRGHMRDVEKYKIVSRTAKMAVVEDVYGKRKRRMVNTTSDGTEWLTCYTSPFGREDDEALYATAETTRRPGYFCAGEAKARRVEEEHRAVYEPEYWEEVYSDYAGDNSHPEQDIPAPHIRVKKAARPVASIQAVHTRPTPKSKERAYRFTCKDAGTLRKILNTGTVETVKAIAESYVEFQPRTDGKHMSKKFYVDAIVRLYFPQEQAKPAPAKQARPEFQGERFVEGKVYIQTRWDETRLYKVIQRKKNRITFVEVSPHDLTEYISAPEDRTVKHIGTITEYIIPNARHHGDLLATNTYGRLFFSMYYTPGYDVDFDETAYSPDADATLAMLDDVPESKYSGASATVTVSEVVEAVKNAPTFEAIYEVLKQYPIEMIQQVYEGITGYFPDNDNPENLCRNHYALATADRIDYLRRKEGMCRYKLRELSYRKVRLEHAKEAVARAGREYRVVKTASLNGNKYLTRMLVELKREYRTALERYRMARHKLRKCEAWLAANF